MNKKVLSIMAALLLMITTFVPYTKALAQGLVEYAIILVVVAFNKTDEYVEIAWVPSPSQATPQNPNRTEGDVQITFDLQAGAGGGICSQIIQTSVETTPGLNVMTVAINGTNLVVNGEMVEELDSNCFDNAARLRIGVGRPLPPIFADQVPEVPPEFRAGLPNVLSYSVVNKSNGSTAATSGHYAGNRIIGITDFHGNLE